AWCMAARMPVRFSLIHAAGRAVVTALVDRGGRVLLTLPCSASRAAAAGQYRRVCGDRIGIGYPVRRHGVHLPAVAQRCRRSEVELFALGGVPPSRISGAESV